MKAGIALGSNLGNRNESMWSGFQFLQSLAADGQIFRSSLLETEPVDCPPGSPPFLNAVAEIETLLPPRELLGQLQHFERQLGRAAVRPVNAPRPLDLDILYYGDLIVNEPGLVVPHPRLLDRLFVLKPLAEIRPELILPGQTRTIREFLRQLETS